MSKNKNPFLQLVKFAIIAGGSVVLATAIYRLTFSVPDLRYLVLFGLAMVVSWPGFKFPMNAAEPLFFLVLLVYGAPAAILLSTMATLVATRTLLNQDRLLYFSSVGQSALSAAATGLVINYLLPALGQTPQFISDPSIPIINVLAWMAWTRFLFYADWPAVAEALRAHKIRASFTDGQWLNSFVAYFGAAFTAGVVLLIAREQKAYVALLSLLILVIFYFAYRHFKEKYIEKYKSVQHKADEISELHLRTIEALAGAIEAKGSQSSIHSQCIQLYTEGVGQSLELPEPELKALRAASVLRDIGKLAVPDYLLHKSENLTEAEIEKIQLHTVVGASILERAGFPYPLVPAVKHHHEHWDGTGYPDRLCGEAIPITARILAVADDFDAAYSKNPGPFARSEAINLLLRESGHKYDPAIVQTFLEILPQLESQVALLDILPRNANESAFVTTLQASAKPAYYLDEIRSARQEVTELIDLARALSSTLNIEEAVSIIVSRLSRLINCDTYAIYLYDESSNTAYVRGAVGLHADKLVSQRVTVRENTVWHALAKNQPTYSSEAAQELTEFDPKIQQAFKSIAVYPLTKAGKMLGAIALLSSAPNSYSNEHSRVIEIVAPLAADALFNAMTYRDTEARALTDVLTGLPNSRYLVTSFEQESYRAERYATTMAMLMIDLDGFKLVNDTFGHQAGDHVLREVARCLKQELRAGDPLIRYAGDEFIALLPYAEERSIGDLIARIQRHLEAYRFPVNGIEVRIGASIGYAIYGRDGRTLDELMRVADIAMYRNKSVRKKQIKPRIIKAPNRVNKDKDTKEVEIIFDEAVAS